MNKELFLREFMDDIWNKKNIEKVKQYVHPEYTIHVDNADPWEGKTLNNAEFKERLKYSFDSYAELLMINGDLEASVKNYQKAVDIAIGNEDRDLELFQKDLEIVKQKLKHK